MKDERKSKFITIRVSKEVKDLMQSIANVYEITVSELYRNLITNYCRDYEKAKKK